MVDVKKEGKVPGRPYIEKLGSIAKTIANSWSWFYIAFVAGWNVCVTAKIWVFEWSGCKENGEEAISDCRVARQSVFYDFSRLRQQESPFAQIIRPPIQHVLASKTNIQPVWLQLLRTFDRMFLSLASLNVTAAGLQITRTFKGNEKRFESSRTKL